MHRGKHAPGRVGDRRTMRRNLRELPPSAWFLTGGAFVNRFASFAAFFLVLYLRKLGYGIGPAGIAVGAFGLGGMLGVALGGHLADRIGRKRTIALSMFGSAATMVVLSQIHAYPGLVAAAFLAGFAAEMYRPAGGALLADLVPEGQRISAFALLRFAVNLGFALGVAVAGFLADHSFVWVFLSDAATSVIFGVMALTLLPEGRRTTREEERAAGVGYRTILSNRAFLAFLVASVLVAFVYFQQQTTLPLHVRAHGLSNSDFGLLLSLNGLLVVLLELPLSSWTMHRPVRQMIAVGFLLVGLGFGLTAVADSFAPLAVTVVVWTLGEMIGAPVAYAYVADLAPGHMRGRYQALFELFWGAGTVLGPVLGTLAYAASPTMLWSLSALLGLVAALIVLSTRPTRMRTEIITETPLEARVEVALADRGEGAIT
jgi:MFS family permease